MLEKKSNFAKVKNVSYQTIINQIKILDKLLTHNQTSLYGSKAIIIINKWVLNVHIIHLNQKFILFLLLFNIHDPN